ncbi:MAG: hypothetical protein WEA10_04905 [Actinomycetota bacterium]
MALVLAIYAAVVSTVAIGWEVFKWVKTRSLDVLVQAETFERQSMDGVVETFFVARVHNRGTFSVRVTGVAVQNPASPPQREAYFTGADVGILDGSRTVHPHDAEEIHVPIWHLKGDLPDGDFLVRVLLSTGDRISSTPIRSPYTGLGEPLKLLDEGN